MLVEAAEEEEVGGQLQVPASRASQTPSEPSSFDARMFPHLEGPAL